MRQVDDYLKYSAMTEVFCEVIESECDGGYEILMSDCDIADDLTVCGEYAGRWNAHIAMKVGEIYSSLKIVIAKVKEMEQANAK
jgi:hypothetical protein